MNMQIHDPTSGSERALPLANSYRRDGDYLVGGPEPLIPLVEAVQHFLSGSRSTADRLRKSGKLGIVRISGRVYTTEAEIGRFIATARAETARRLGRV